MSRLTKEDIYALAVLLGITSVYYLFLIFQFPQFYLDDYYVFSRISTSSLPISIDPSERYYLFVRPIEYLYFWLIYSIAGANPVLMKIFGFLLLILLLIVMYCTVKRIQGFLSVSIPKYACVLACLFLASHPDVVSSVLWISNSNEILMTLFYCGSIYFLLDDKFDSAHLAISLLLFVLSSLVKQQSLHYPFLVMFLIVLRWKSLSDQARRNLLIVAAVGIMVIVVHTIVNYRVYVRPSDIDLVGSIWKKPFSILGTIFYLLLPFWGVDVYFLFLTHKLTAFLSILLLLLAVLGIVFYSKKKISDPLKALLLIVFVLIIFFPRILAPGGIRLNTLQLLWLATSLGILFSHLPRFRTIVAAGLLLGNIMACQQLISKYRRVDNQVIEAALRLREVSESCSKKVYVVSGPSTKLLAYISHFLSRKEFGVDQAYYCSTAKAYSFDDSELIFQDVSVARNGPVISVSVKNQSSNRMFLGADFTSSEKIIRHTDSPLRGYQTMDFEPSPPLSDTTVVFVYYDGTVWLQMQKAL